MWLKYFLGMLELSLFDRGDVCDFDAIVSRWSVVILRSSILRLYLENIDIKCVDYLVVRAERLEGIQYGERGV